MGLATENTRVTMAGDPKQLGPVETLDFMNKRGLCQLFSFNRNLK